MVERKKIWRSSFGSSIALGLTALLIALGCVMSETLKPAPGIMQYMEPLMFDLPDAKVSLATGNLHIKRTDISFEYFVGTMEIGAVYNSANNKWLWNFEMENNGHHFTDPSGAWHDISHVGIGEEIPGTHWVVSGPFTMRTKSGLTYTFENQKLDSIHWENHPYPRLKMVRSEIHGADRVTEIGMCMNGELCGALIRMEYDNLGRLARIEGPGDNPGASFGYDDEGRLIQAQNSQDIEQGQPGWTYGYVLLADGSSTLSSMTRTEGERVDFEFHGPRNQLSKVTRIGEGNPETHFQYRQSAPGQYETTVTQPDGSNRQYLFDPVWRLASLENEVGDIETYEWTGMKLASRTDKAGLKTSWSYVIDKQDISGYGHIPSLETKTEVQPSGNLVVTRFQRTALHLGPQTEWPVLSVTDSLGTLVAREYDALGRITSSTNGADEGTFFGYGIYDGVFSSTIYRSRDLYGYAAIRNFSGQFYQAFFSADVGYVRTAPWEYDAIGNLIRGGGTDTPTAAGRAGIASRSFDSSRLLNGIELWSEEDWTTSHLSLDHRSDGQITRITRPHGGDTEFAYDSLGRKNSRRDKTDGVWQTTAFEYDLRDRQTAIERPNGMRTETRYDAAGQIVEVRHLRDGELEKSVVNTWVDGYLIEQLDSRHAGPELSVYDGAGNLAEIHYPDGETLETVYDLRGRPTQNRYWLADGSLLRAIGLTYDAAGRTQTLSEDQKVLLEWHYGNGVNASGMVGWDHGIGSIEWIQYGNGLRRTFELKPGLNLIESYRASQTEGGSIENTQLRLQIDCRPGFSVPTDCIRITETALPTGREDQIPVERYELSPGNRIKESAGLQHRLETPLARPRVVASGVWAENGLEGSAYLHIHDSLANQTRGLAGEVAYNTERNRLLSGGGHNYQYDEAGFVTMRDDVSFTWDAMGRIAGVGNNQYVWDSRGRPLSKTENGTQTRYLFGGAIETDATMNPTVLDLAHVRLDLRNGAHQYRHFDFRNNVQFVTDDEGEVLQSFTYNAYGVESLYDASTDTLSFAQGESLGGVMRLGSRLYDPDIGRFLSPDPIYQVVNQYSYAEGNPVEFWDPEGEQCTVTIHWNPGKTKWNKDIWEVVIKCKSCGLGFESGLAIAGIAALRHRRRTKRNKKAQREQAITSPLRD